MNALKAGLRKHARTMAAAGLFAFTITALIEICVARLEHQLLAPDGASGPELLQMILAVPLSMVLLGLPLPILLFSLPRRTRRIAAHLGAFWIAVPIAMVTFGSLREGEFRRGFERVASHSEPLVHAIERYAVEEGTPPESLAVLVQRYLSAIPSTGIGAYPDYEYRVIPDSLRGESPSPWELSVPCGRGPLNWDQFFYWPSHRYPSFIYSGTVQRIADWAYVHE